MSNAKQSIGVAPTYSAPFTPADLTGLWGWYTFDDNNVFSDTSGATKITEGGGAAYVNDRSENGNYLRASNTTTRPPTWNAGTGAGGQPGLTFDGTSDTLYTPTLSAALTDAIHIFMIYEPVDAGWAANKYVWANIDETLTHILQTFNVKPNVRTYHTSAGSQDVNAVTGADHLIEGLYTTGSVSLIIDDHTATTDAIGTNAFKGLRIGAASDTGSFHNMIASELVIVNNTVTGTELTNLRSYFAGKFGVTTN